MNASSKPLKSASASERALESALLARLKDFLIEMGSGFAFVGNQYRLEVDGDEFFLDLLFYHTRLHCYIVIDLKVVDFEPEFAGKMSFYQAALDNLIKTPQDAAAIGIILCRGKNKTVVEYTLRDAKSPMGVAEYRLLPPKLKAKLPPVANSKTRSQESTSQMRNTTGGDEVRLLSFVLYGLIFKLKRALCPHSLAVTLTALPSMSLLPVAPFLIFTSAVLCSSSLILPF